MSKHVLLVLAVMFAFQSARSAELPEAAISPATKEVRLPDTPAGRALADWLVAFNRQNIEIYRQYMERRSPALVKYVQNDFDFALAVGGFTPIQVDAGGDYSLSGLLSEPYADFPTRFSIRLDRLPPHHILDLDLSPADRPVDMPLPVLDEAELIRALEDRLEAQSADSRFSGVVLLARGDQILFHRAYGSSNLLKSRKNTLDTRFRIASMGKMFTAVSVMQLAAAGKLDLHAPLLDVLPDYPNSELAQKVTLHQLLTHTGGTGDIFVPEIESRRDRIQSHADYINLLGHRALEFEPGSEWRYSNYGFVLLGRAIERTSGEAYFDYVRKNVSAPADMRHSGSNPIEKPMSPVASGYSRRRDHASWQPARSGMPDVASAAGGDVSTALDLFNFARALQTGKLLDAADFETMTRGKVDAPFGRYAYGFKDQSREGIRYIGHGGGAPGSNCELDIYPDSGYIVVVLTNQDPPYGNRVAEFIGNRLAVSGRRRDQGDGDAP